MRPAALGLASLSLAPLLLTSALMPASAPGAGAPATGDPGCNSGWPVSAYYAGPGASSPAPAATLPVACGVATGYAASETTLAAANDGALVFSPANTENTLARSADRGASWQLTGPAQLQQTSLWNTVDPQVVADWRTGRLFWVHTTYTVHISWPLPDQSPAAWLVPTAVADAHGFQVYRSEDGGSRWQTADYSQENTADWEKLFTGPPPSPRTGAPQPSGYPDVVYVCANAPLEVIGPGRACYRSLDGGATFARASYQFPSAAAPSGCPALAANTGVVGADGTVYIPQSCAGGTYLAVSHDEASSFTWRRVPGAPAANGLGAAVQLVMDRAGDLYLLWLASDSLELARSPDGGHTWSAPITVSPPGVHNLTLPALAAGPDGNAGIAFYAATNPAAKTLTAYLAQSGDAMAPDPLFYCGAVNDPAHPIFENYGDDYSPRADFIGAAYDQSGQFWGGFVKQLGPPNSANQIPTSGYVAHLAFGTGP